MSCQYDIKSEADPSAYFNNNNNSKIDVNGLKQTTG